MIYAHPTLPTSKLTASRPDIWARALLLATSLTGYQYAAKVPAADGTIWACGGGRYYVPPTFTDKIKDKRKKIDLYEKWIKEVNPNEDWTGSINEWKGLLERAKKELEDLLRELNFTAAPRVFIPEGAMEWLLHEVGHYVAATPAERLLPNYGYGQIKLPGWGYAREWQAWGFEEIIMAPFGSSREFAPPTQQDGVAFAKAGPMPSWATRHAEANLRALSIEVGQWREVYGDWVKWGKA